MAAQVKVTLDRNGIGAILKSQEVADLVNPVAHRVAAHAAAASGMDVVVDSYVTDRAAAAVVVLDSRATSAQAKHGILTRAAAAEGLEVRAR